MGRILAWASVLIAGVCPAQSISLVNHGFQPWEGWVRVQTGPLPAWTGGWTTPMSMHWEKCADDETADVWLQLAGGASATVPIGTMEPVVRPVPVLPSDPWAVWAGVPSVNGVPLGWSFAGADGAAVSVRGSTMIDGWNFTLWFLYYPATAHVGVTMRIKSGWAQTQPSDFLLTWGDAQVLVRGSTPHLLVPSGTYWASGEERTVRATAVWSRLMRSPVEWSWAQAAHNGDVR